MFVCLGTAWLSKQFRWYDFHGAGVIGHAHDVQAVRSTESMVGSLPMRQGMLCNGTKRAEDNGYITRDRIPRRTE